MTDRRRQPRRLSASAVMLLAASLLLRIPAEAASATTSSTQRLEFHGTFTPSAQGAGHGTPGTFAEIPPHQPNSKTRRHVAAAGVPAVAGTALTAAQLPGFGGFNGLSHRDQRLAGTGVYENTQFSLEPPDQGLCVAGGNVVEAVNNAMQVFDTSGSALTVPIALSQFFGLSPEVIRTTPPVFGDFISDPRCYFDPDTARWVLTELEIDLDPATGDFADHSMLLIAVSQTADPTGTWSIFTLDVTDDGTGGTPNIPGCPCFGDQPLIGADANGFYITTNEYTLETFAFTGAHVFAMSKTGLESGSNTTAVRIFAGPMTLTLPDGGLAYSLQPATSPNAGYETANNGTEYFLSGTDWGVAPALGTRANRMLVWALTNSGSLNSATPSVSLSFVVVGSELYAQPSTAQQKSGPTPLGDLVHNPLELLNANEDRTQQAVFADGKLWSGLNTAVKLPNGATMVGIAWFIVTPSDPSGTLSATMTNQGYLAVNRENVMFPSIGVNDDGESVIAFTLVGPDFFPSAAYAPLDPVAGAGEVRISGPGALPEDGFAGYRAFGFDGVTRWGDYSAAVADTAGTIWMATEYIPDAPRTLLANWGTFISHVSP
jgi:hypothetical protein